MNKVKYITILVKIKLIFNVSKIHGPGAVVKNRLPGNIEHKKNPSFAQLQAQTLATGKMLYAVLRPLLFLVYVFLEKSPPVGRDRLAYS